MNKNTMVKYNTYIEDTTIGNGVNPLVELVIHKEKWYEFSKRFFIYGLKKYMMKYYTPSFYNKKWTSFLDTHLYVHQLFL